MKIVVERSGGFAGLIRRGEQLFTELSAEQKAALQSLLDKGDALAAPQPGADRFTYRIELQDANGTKTLTVPEDLMPKCLAGIATGRKP